MCGLFNVTQRARGRMRVQTTCARLVAAPHRLGVPPQDLPRVPAGSVSLGSGLPIRPICMGSSRYAQAGGQTLGKGKINQMASVLRSPPSAEGRHGNRRRGGGVMGASREVTHRTQAAGNLGTFPTGEASAELKGRGKQGQKKRER